MSDLKDEEVIAKIFSKTENARTATTLILYRSSLTLGSKLLPINDIQFFNFKMTKEDMMKYAIVMFVDNDNTTKIIKNKYGNTGTL